MARPDLRRYYEIGHAIKLLQDEREQIKDQILITYCDGKHTLEPWQITVSHFETRRLDRAAVEAEYGNLTRFETISQSVRVDVKPTKAAILESVTQ